MQSDIKTCFSKSARSYDTYAQFQLFAAQKLVDMIDIIPRHILDIGCGTGILTALLRQKFPNIRCTLLDISSEMLTVAKQKLGGHNIDYICASANNNTLIAKIITKNNIDMIVSNLCFQWFDDPDFYIQTYQSYAPICISVLLENSFYQWYESVITQSPDFKPPISMLPNDTTDTLFEYHIEYKNGLDFLQSQKKLGTLVNPNKKLTTKQLKNACKIFEEKHNSIISYYLGIIADFG